jgi:hypothetical protein
MTVLLWRDPPLPRQVVEGNVQMTDARGQVSCGSTAHGQDAQVFHRYGINATTG